MSFPKPGPRTASPDTLPARLAAHVAGARRRAKPVAPVAPAPPAPVTTAFSRVRRVETPESRARVDALKSGMRVAEAAAQPKVGDVMPVPRLGKVRVTAVEPEAQAEWAEVKPVEARPTRAHANAKHEKPDRRFDTSALHFDLHGKLMSHADYLAHCEKYDFAWRSIRDGDRVLDVGCGTDQALMRAICMAQSQATKMLHDGCYVGVDLNPLKETKVSWAQIYGEIDMTSEEGFDLALSAIPGNVTKRGDPVKRPRGYTLIVCLEVIEHMDVADGTRLLENLRDLLSPGGRIILSTPVYDGKAMARNHIHEYYVDELAELVASVGLTVTRRMGTFTSEPVIKRWMRENRPDWLALYEESRQFHSAGYLSGLIAPMVPDLSRNNVWELTK